MVTSCTDIGDSDQITQPEAEHPILGDWWEYQRISDADTVTMDYLSTDRIGFVDDTTYYFQSNTGSRQFSEYSIDDEQFEVYMTIIDPITVIYEYTLSGDTLIVREERAYYWSRYFRD